MSHTLPDVRPEVVVLKLADLAGEVEGCISGFLDHRPLPSHLREAARYSLLSGGKRLRPGLVMWCCRAVGGDPSDALVPAAAIEMIHCFSLIHDDLPAIDNDDLRRGRPTLHRHTNEAMAILAGDLVMCLAFEIIATRLESADLVGRLTRELAEATNDMIAGQVYDTLPNGVEKTDPVEQLQTTHRLKTGALFRCAARMGGICGSADSDQVSALTRYAESVGLMFQVVDDLLDVTQTTEHLGKAANKDAEQGKVTYPGVLGIDASRAEVERLRREAHEALEPLGSRADNLRQLCEYLAVRQK